DRCRVGDGVPVGVAHREFHRDGAAALARIHAAAVAVDWRQNDASHLRPTAGPERNLQRPVNKWGEVVIGCADGAHFWGDRVSPGKESTNGSAGEGRATTHYRYCIAAEKTGDRRREWRVHRCVENLRLVISGHRQVRLGDAVANGAVLTVVVGVGIAGVEAPRIARVIPSILVLRATEIQQGAEIAI